MSALRLVPESLTADGFAGYGDVIEARGRPDLIINAGRCGRYHDLARLDFGDGRPGLSVFDAQEVVLPHRVDLVERHPMGSQAFLPLGGAAVMLIVVAGDAGGVPSGLRAFVSAPGQGVNLQRGIWHGVLTPLGGDGQFAVIDRVGAGDNLEEYRLDPSAVVVPP
ncbi:Ureidoglycolate hydrolase [Roseovarius sp. TE539]|uniref:ureidoglycolate lyase n=1 Tax=Roseovarius sp. TE539 TaxID=2249812 RepID=UPI000DDEF7BC|nr:ureidoglycolate lyase [Roseovarius sp. TE539]RBI73060.1 Ureidoglycolate hydrolase [Roseovarius sp. TE539]